MHSICQWLCETCGSLFYLVKTIPLLWQTFLIIPQAFKDAFPLVLAESRSYRSRASSLQTMADKGISSGRGPSNGDTREIMVRERDERPHRGQQYLEQRRQELEDHLSRIDPHEPRAASSQDNGLSNDVHPIFTPSHFDSSIDYQLITPALRLASRFLAVEEMLPFWNMLLLGQVKKIEEDHDGRRIYVGPSEDSCEFTPTQASDTKTALLLLSLDVTFGRLAHSDSNFADGTSGVTRPLPKSSEWHRFKGSKSRIVIDLDRIESTVAERATLESSIQFLGESLRIALTLFHELCHAARVASFPDKLGRGSRNYILLDGCSSSEEGFEGERCLFGGIITSRRKRHMPNLPFPCDPDTNIPLYISYPYQAIIHTYRENPLCPDIYLREGSELYDGAAALGPQSVETLFTDMFWDNVRSDECVDAFITGILKTYRVDSTGRLMERP